MTVWSDDPNDEPPALDVRWLHLGRPFLDLLVRAVLLEILLLEYADGHPISRRACPLPTRR